MAAGGPRERLQANRRGREERTALIAHRFYGSDGKIMVDRRVAGRGELPARSSPSMEPTIGPMMQQVATGEPEITFWTKLETGDDVGWEA